MEQLPPTQGLRLAQAIFRGCFCLWGTARPQKPRSPWSEGSVFSPSFLNLTPPSASHGTAFSFGLLAPKTAGSKASLVILGIFHVHCFQVLIFCLNSHGQFKSRFNTRSDIRLFLEILLPPLSSCILAWASHGYKSNSSEPHEEARLLPIRLLHPCQKHVRTPWQPLLAPIPGHFTSPTALTRSNV